MLRLCSRVRVRRLHVPFGSDLEPADSDLFNLQDFQHYRPQVQERSPHARSFADFCRQPQPAVLTSALQNPYLNLAIEDYVYSTMPADKPPSDRLLFYTNSPCVVVGKNQNPWREVNLAALSSLRVPLVRRRSGGGTVVHDTGNVNFSYMTLKDNFDRFRFAQLICRAVNPALTEKITVNERGDIVTENGALKVSGSAYKLSRGKSYHHGTMLLNSRLDVLRQLLRRDESMGCVQDTAAIASVKSPVTNIHLPNAEFMQLVRAEFDAAAPHFLIDEETELPAEIRRTADELGEWDWRYGSTPKFSHIFTHPVHKFRLSFEVGKKAVVESMSIDGASVEIEEAFEYLDAVLSRGDELKYTGSNLAGFVLDDELSEWLGNSIDGTS